MRNFSSELAAGQSTLRLTAIIGALIPLLFWDPGPRRRRWIAWRGWPTPLCEQP